MHCQFVHCRPAGFAFASPWLVIVAISCVAQPLLAIDAPVTALAIAPGCEQVVMGSQSGVFVCRLRDFDDRTRLESELVEVHSLAFSPSGKRIAVAGGVPGEQGMVEIFAWPDVQLEQRIRGHEDTIESVIWRDEQTLATGSLDHEIVLWDLASSKPWRRLKGHSKGVTTLAFVSGGNQLLSGSIDQNIRLWNVESGDLVRTLNNHTRGIHEASLRPGTQSLPMVATVSDDRTVRLWQPTIGRMVRFCRLDSTPLSVTWVDQGRDLAVSCEDGTVRLIDPETAEIEQVSDALTGWGYVLKEHPAGTAVVVGGSNGELELVSFSH